VPAILHAPAPLLAKQWRTAWEKAKATLPAATIACTGIFAFLAYREDRSTSAFKLYLTSALLLPTVIPYTRLLIGPINKKLVEKSDSLASTSITDASAEAGISKEDTVHALVDKWASLNLVRAVISGAAALTAMWATLNPVEVVAASGVTFATGANRIS
jgi:hypothetical protein